MERLYFHKMHWRLKRRLACSVVSCIRMWLQMNPHEKALKSMVDYNDVRPLKSIETEQDEKKLSTHRENKQALLHPDRIREISQYIINNFDKKTHRLQASSKSRFNAYRANTADAGTTASHR